MMKAYVSTETKKWQSGEILQKNAADYDLVIGEEKAEFWGFGGCFNEHGYAALVSLGEKERTEILDRLFLSDLRLVYCRLPIGASDYALDWYSYNETDGDYAMEYFSIERDRENLIPYVKEALKRKPNIKFFASPWSPPTWMKSPKVYNYGKIVPTAEVFNAYALYFVKYVQAYAAEGIVISAIHIQNEIYADQKFPSCLWDAKTISVFVHDYLAPAFRKYGINAEIWLGTVNGGAVDFENTVFPLLVGDVKHDICGVAYQWAGKEAVELMAQSFPDVPFIQSENECGDGKNSWSYCKYCFGLARHYIKLGARAYCYWNMILPAKNGRSTWGWEQNCMVSTEGDVQYNNEFYLFKHLSRFVGAGSRTLDLSKRFASMALAFRNSEGQTVIIVENPLSENRALSFQCNGIGYQVNLPADSIATIVMGKNE